MKGAMALYLSLLLLLSGSYQLKLAYPETRSTVRKEQTVSTILNDNGRLTFPKFFWIQHILSFLRFPFNLFLLLFLFYPTTERSTLFEVKLVVF